MSSEGAALGRERAAARHLPHGGSACGKFGAPSDGLPQHALRGSGRADEGHQVTRGCRPCCAAALARRLLQQRADECHRRTASTDRRPALYCCTVLEVTRRRPPSVSFSSARRRRMRSPIYRLTARRPARDALRQWMRLAEARPPQGTRPERQNLFSAVGRIGDGPDQFVGTSPESTARACVADDVVRLDQQLLTGVRIGREQIDVARTLVGPEVG
jgi:hypothetical protein